MEDRMPWNNTARVEHRRDCARYRSDLTDREWGLIEPLLPAARPGGRPRTTDMRDVVETIRHRFPWLRHVFADGGYAGPKRRAALNGHGDWTIQVIKRSDTAKGFEVLPRRWVVERTFAWLRRCRRLAKDWEASIESSTACAFISSISLITCRLARYCYVS
jgi:transposase